MENVLYAPEALRNLFSASQVLDHRFPWPITTPRGRLQAAREPCERTQKLRVHEMLSGGPQEWIPFKQVMNRILAFHKRKN